MTPNTDPTPEPHGLHDLAAPYALHALDDDERALFEAHLDQCDSCRREVASFVDTTARLAESSATTPPPSLRAAVLADITTVRQDPPPVVARPSTDQDAAVSPGGDHEAAVAPSLVERLSRVSLGLAAALALIAGALGFMTVNLQQQVQDQQQQAERIAAVLGHHDSVDIRHNGAAVVIGPDNTAVLASAVLRPPDDEHVLQVWVIDEHGPHSAGVVADATKPHLLDVPVTEGTTVGVTVEPSGGSDQPTTEPIWAAEV